MDWSKEKVHSIVEKQRIFFKSGKTLDIKFRKEQLKKLKAMIIKNQKAMEEALHQDLNRAPLEAYMCDIGAVISELNETLHCLSRWARPEHHFSDFACFPSMFTKVYKMPYGVSLIVSPFNFPFLLSLGVLVAAISGGNTAVIKASSKSKYCTELMQKMIAETFPEDYVTVIDGGHDVADWCLEERFDKIFYTGSPKVGIHVMECAAKNLTPVALELGGENGNWCIVRKDADIKDAARKIAFFKICNSGQICININQVAVASEIADEFVKELKAAMIKQIGEDAVNNPEYAKLIARSAYDWCAKEADEYRDRIVFGGFGNPETQKYNPTIIYPVDIDEKICNHELFSPLLPVVKFNDSEIDSLLNTIANREHGLALYLFTKDMKWAKKVMRSQQYGGGCVNEVCIHLLVKGVPFNGTGHSGMGAYHGVWGFREFTHPSTVLFGKTKCNLDLREHPFNDTKSKLMHKFIK
ncbi:MAG: aldehyde dehydrogenase family protein [Bacilli bacterium]|nr:aldehyde dehydrogenase family protein [Bacilli bacterium]